MRCAEGAVRRASGCGCDRRVGVGGATRVQCGRARGGAGYVARAPPPCCARAARDGWLSYLPSLPTYVPAHPRRPLSRSRTHPSLEVGAPGVLGTAAANSGAGSAVKWLVPGRCAAAPPANSLGILVKTLEEHPLHCTRVARRVSGEERAHSMSFSTRLLLALALMPLLALLHPASQRRWRCCASSKRARPSWRPRSGYWPTRRRMH